jgi:tRNA (guanine37-N1)-methyltransferase
MLSAKVALKDAERVKKLLVEKKLIDTNYLLLKDKTHLYFPVIKKVTIKGVLYIEKRLHKKSHKVTIQSLLKGKLTPKELELIPKSQEVIGSILILEIPESIIKKEKEIAQAYLTFNKNVKTVVKKSKIHSGIFRTRGVKILAGKRTKETKHLESSVTLKLHIEKTYFSARLGHERLRIAKQIKKGEEILVMFSGCAPYPLILAKHSPAKSIFGIEINPDAHKFGIENIKLNKFEDKVKLINGDVRKVLPKLKKKFDRILMPLPKTSEEFLDVALSKIKKGGIIHLYAFLNEKDIDKEALRFKQICKDLGHSTRILKKIKCGQHAPYTFRVCYDIKVL